MAFLLHPDDPFIALILNHRAGPEWDRRVSDKIMHFLLFVVPEALDAEPGDALIADPIREHPHPQPADRGDVEFLVRSRFDRFLQPIEVTLRTVHDVVVNLERIVRGPVAQAFGEWHAEGPLQH